MWNKLFRVSALAVTVLMVTQLLQCSRRGRTTGVARSRGDTRQPLRPAAGAPSGGVAFSKGGRLENLRYGSDPDQLLDVYLPRGARKAPVLVMVHGGAWMYGDKEASPVVTNKVAHWVPKGYIVVSVDYRLSPPEPLRQAGEVAKALAFAQSKAGTWGGDPTRFLLMGHSAGAHLVSLLAADPALARAEGAQPWLGSVILDSAAFDVEQIMKGRHAPFYDQVFRRDPDYWRRTSPSHRLRGAPRPMLVVCSSQRRDACAQARDFAGRVTALGGSARVLPVAKTHREVNQDLGLPGPYTDEVVGFIRSLGLP